MGSSTRQPVGVIGVHHSTPKSLYASLPYIKPSPLPVIDGRLQSIWAPSRATIAKSTKAEGYSGYSQNPPVAFVRGDQLRYGHRRNRNLYVHPITGSRRLVIGGGIIHICGPV